MLFYANSLIVIEFCHDSIKKINFLYFRCGRSGDYLTVFKPRFSFTASKARRHYVHVMHKITP